MNSGDLSFTIIAVAIIAAVATCAIVKRVTRSINIAKHGWPPQHLDADGDQVESGSDGCDCDFCAQHSKQDG